MLDAEGVAGVVDGALGTWVVRELQAVLNRSSTLNRVAEAHVLLGTLGAGTQNGHYDTIR